MIDPYLPFRIGLVQAAMREAIKIRELNEQRKRLDEQQEQVEKLYHSTLVVGSIEGTCTRIEKPLLLTAEPTGEVLSSLPQDNNEDYKEGG